MEAQFQLYSLAPSGPDRLLAFTIHADSGKMPGAEVTPDAGAVTAGAVTGAGVAANGISL